MDRTRSKNLIKALIELISFHVFAIGFIFTHRLPNNPINFFLLLLVIMVVLYKEFVLPMKPNERFVIIYSIIFIVVCALGFKTMNIFVMILIFSQLAFLFLIKYMPKKYNVVAMVIEDFVVPTFMSVAIFFYYTHFISINFVVPLLLVNITAIMITYFDGDINSYVQIIAISIATVVLFFLGYINILSTIAIIAYALAMVLLKIFDKFSEDDVVNRLIGNILLII